MFIVLNVGHLSLSLSLASKIKLNLFCVNFIEIGSHDLYGQFIDVSNWPFPT